MKKRTRNLLKSRGGFSKLQNIMIFLIVLIIAGVGGLAFYGYIQSSYQVKAAHTARKVFDGAQDYLSDKVRGGSLEEFNRRSSHFGGLVTMDLQKQILTSIYEGDEFDVFFAGYQEKYQDVPVRYLVMESASAALEDRDQNPVLEMLEYHVLDDNIVKHAFLIEYNGNTGQVMAVLYSEKTDGFTYEGDVNNKNNAILRDTSSLDQKWQGYFGLSPEEL